MIPIYWSIMVLFFAAFIMPVFGHLTKKHFELRGFLAFLAILASLFVLTLDYPNILAGKILIYEMGAWVAPFGIVLAVDALNYVVALLVLFSSALVTLYSIKHVEVRTGLSKYYTLLLLITLGMLGVVLTGDLFNLYVFFEIMSIASYALVAFRSKKLEAVEGSFKFIILGSLATSFMLLGISYLYSLTGTLNMADLATKLPGLAQTPAMVAFSLLLVGFGFKAVLVPLHAWKPDALQGATSEVAGLIAGVSSGVGLYCLFRVSYTIFSMTKALYYLLLFLSMATIIVGAFMALVQTDLKRLLAYSSISQSGYVALGLTLGVFSATGAIGGIFHLVNHAIAKILLFMCAGVIVYKTGTHDMNNLGGLARKMPITAFAFLIGALAVIGIPFTNGFMSKLFIYMAGIEIGSPIITIIALVMSVVTFAYYAKAFYKIFLGTGNTVLKTKKEMHAMMLVPILILLTICIILGVYPKPALSILELSAKALVGKTAYIAAVLP